MKKTALCTPEQVACCITVTDMALNSNSWITACRHKLIKRSPFRNKRWFVIVLIFSALAMLREAVLQYRDSVYVTKMAWRIVRAAHAEDSRSRVIALRDYLRATVRYEGAPYENRPFLRSTAAETLQTRLGYCGEVSRAFINMAAAMGIPAQRINLYGGHKHVAAEVELRPGERLVVDAQNPPSIVDLEPLDQVILRPEYDDYYSLNLRRLHINWLITRVRLEMGPLTYWLENPHAMKAGSWGLLIVLLLLMKGTRFVIRIALHRRGWIHISSLDSLTPPRPDVHVGGRSREVGQPVDLRTDERPGSVAQF